MAYVEQGKDKYIKLSQALEVLDSCACWWAHERMESIPAADVRPVVLCRDCTFFKPQQKSKRWSSTTPMCSRSATIKMPPDGFCSFGVKREERDGT